MPPFLLVGFSAAVRPAIGLAVLELFWYLMEKTPLAFLTGDWLYAIKFGLFFWAGWIVLKHGGALVDAAIAGAFAGLAVEVSDLILDMVLYRGYGLGYWIGDFIKWIIIAAIVAAIGFFIAKSRQAPPPTV